MNKFSKQSQAARARRRRFKSCESKVRYTSPAAAHQQGQEAYYCRLCNGWHRSGSLASLAGQLK